MLNSYQVLGLEHDADEAAIRARYLELVRQFPPEREPQKFAEIRAAYDHLRDPLVSLEHRLFDIRVAHTFEQIAAETRPNVRARRISTDVLLSLGAP